MCQAQVFFLFFICAALFEALPQCASTSVHPWAQRCTHPLMWFWCLVSKTHFLPFPLMIAVAWSMAGTQLIFIVCCLSTLTPLCVQHSALNRCLWKAATVSQTSWYARHWLRTQDLTSLLRLSDTQRPAGYQSCAILTAQCWGQTTGHCKPSVRLSSKKDFK